MGAFVDPNFVKEFVFRTKINYYNLRLLQESDKAEIARIEKSLETIKDDMKNRGYIIDDFYEVTQLINSMIGLLVFPEQVYFDMLSTKLHDLKEKYPTLEKYISGEKGKYYSSYKNKNGAPERKNPKNILRHLRNAASHERLSIFPEAARLENGPNRIIGVTFKDRDKSSNEMFELTIAVEDLESVLMEISNAFLEII